MPMPRVGKSFAITLLALATACGTSGEPTAPAGSQAIRVQTVGAEFSRGGAAVLDLVNDSTVTAGTNACAEGLEMLDRGEWERLPAYVPSCYALYISAGPGQRARLSAQLPTDLQPGIYRSRHVLGMGNVRVGYLRYSDAFVVR